MRHRKLEERSLALHRENRATGPRLHGDVLTLDKTVTRIKGVFGMSKVRCVPDCRDSRSCLICYLLFGTSLRRFSLSEKRLAHPHEFGQRLRTHFLHNVAPMHLHVFSAVPISPAICLLSIPRTTRPITSRSRGVPSTATSAGSPARLFTLMTTPVRLE